MKQIRNSFWGSILLLLFITGCDNTEIGESRDVNPDKVYQQYSISLNEEDSAAAVFAQFRFAGEDGTTLVLSKPSRIRFDGENLGLDSSSFTGAYYNASIPPNRFAGKHSFLFTDVQGREMVNSIPVQPLRLIHTPTTVVAGKSLDIPFETGNVHPDDHVDFYFYDGDSSFNVRVELKGGPQTATISARHIAALLKPECTLKVGLSQKFPLQQATSEGGNMLLFHELRPIKIKLLPQPNRDAVVR